ncbi:MAG: hypothetical protein ACP5G4_01815 [bacterium]
MGFKMKTRFFITSIALLAIPIALFGQTFQWVKVGTRIDDSNGVYTEGGIDVDASGNSYVTGYYYAQTTGSERAYFDGIYLPGYYEGAFQSDIFFASYNSSGTIRWANRAGSTSSFERGYDAAFYDGYIYYTGRFSQTYYQGSTSTGVTSSGSDDMFLTKYSSSGTYQWVVKGGGTSSDYGCGIAISSSGDIYVVGYFNGTATFGSYNVTSAGGGDVFLAKYNTSGVCQWVRSAGGTGYDYGLQVDVDPSGNVYICGHFQNTATFGSYNVTSSGSSDMFVAKYNSSGTCQWVRSGGSTEYDEARGVAVDGNNVYVSGYFGNANFTASSQTLTNIGGSDVFMLKYNTSGTLQWARKGGGTSGDMGYRCSIDGAGNGYVIGSFSGTATFTDTSITSAGDDDIFVTCYDSDGDVQYVKYAGGTTQGWGKGIKIGSDGYAYTTGTIWGVSVTFYFDTHTLVAQRNGAWTSRLSPWEPPYIDIGLRIYDGTSNVAIACEPGTPTSRLRIAEDGTVYGIVLVDPSDPSASRIRIQTPDGIKALREY